MNEARNSNTWKVIRAFHCLNLEIVTLANARCARLTSHVVPAGLYYVACYTLNILRPQLCRHSQGSRYHMEFQMYTVKTYMRHGIHLLTLVLLSPCYGRFVCFTLRAIYPPEKDLAVLPCDLGGSEVNE